MWPIVLLCGGLATRMRPLTQSVPKSLLPICDEPFIIHQLRLLKSQGIRDIILCVGYLGEQIEAVVGNGHQFELHVTYVHESDVLLGTGGAIINALPVLPEHFFVMYGDSYLLCDFAHIAEYFKASQKCALMTVFHNKNRWDASNVIFEHGNIKRYDKNNRTPDMHYIDYGLGCFQRHVFTDYPTKTTLDLATIYANLVTAEQLAGVEVTERFYEIGSFDGMREFERFQSQQYEAFTPHNTHGVKT